MNNAERFSADTPVNNEFEDKFGRYEFGKRIAETIVEREEIESLVIGLYGSWGEGKTSILNFISGELSKHTQKIITIKFNPWRFSDEATLLNNFFNKILLSLNQQLVNENQKEVSLKTQKEKIGELLKKYGKLLKITGGIAESAEAAGDLLADIDIEEIKERIEKILLDCQKKFVIIIDDIDRLDKNEIFSILRLVKLTADFKYTTYILSFDDKMVAEAISTRYGIEGNSSGSNFLEKIIQVPLRIPKASSFSLRRYCLELVDIVINKYSVKINQEDVNIFVKHFDNLLLSRLRTPRLAVRYSNSISFSMPLLAGEVNMGDLLLIEAIKIFLPVHYDFIRENSVLFTSIYNNRGKSDFKKRDDLFTRLGELNVAFNEYENAAFKSLFEELFPSYAHEWMSKEIGSKVKHDYEDISPLFGHQYAMWHEKKRITVPMYFNRYFSYSIADGELPDKIFDNFIKEIEEDSIELIQSKIDIWIKCGVGEFFLYKLRTSYDNVNRVVIEKLTIVLTILIGKELESYSTFVKETSGLSWHCVRLIKDWWLTFAERVKKENDFVSELISSVIDLNPSEEFLLEIIEYCSETINGSQILQNQHNQIIYDRIIKKILTDKSVDNIFEKYHRFPFAIIDTWYILNKEEFNNYLVKIFSNNPDYIKRLVENLYYKTFSNTVNYNWYKKRIDVKKLYEIIKSSDRLVNIENIQPNQYNTDVVSKIENFVYLYEVEIGIRQPIQDDSETGQPKKRKKG